MRFPLSASRMFTMSSSRSFARSTISSRLSERMLMISVTLRLAFDGPMRSMVSSAAPMMALSTFSRVEGISMRPLTRPFLLSSVTSMWPIRPLRCSLRRSSASGISPSVWPKMAPMMSLR